MALEMDRSQSGHPLPACCPPAPRAAPHLVHLGAVLQAAAEGVASEAGDDDEQRVQAAVDGGQDDGLGQARVSGDLGQALAQGGEGFSLVQHSCGRATHEGTSLSSRSMAKTVAGGFGELPGEPLEALG